MKPRSSRHFLNSLQWRSLNFDIAFASKPLLLVVACSLGAAFLPQIASAAILTYDSNTTAPANDGPGVWDTSTLNWFDGTNDVAWANGLADTAIFGAAAAGTGGAVVVGAVNVGTIQFNPQTTTGYTLSTGTITLGTGITNTSSVTSIISAKISGTSGLAFSGVAASNASVTLSGANDYTGLTTLSTGGRITSNNTTALGSSLGATASILGGNHTVVGTGTTVSVGNSTAEAFLINGSGPASGGNTAGALRLTSGVTLSSFVQLGSNALITGNFNSSTISGNVDLAGFTASFGNGNNTNTLTISGLVTNAGPAGGMTINDGSGNANVVSLTNLSNSFVGATTVNGGGTLGLGGDTVLGGSTLALNGGTVRSTNATARTIANTITVTGNATFGATATQTGSLNFTYNTAAVSLGSAARTFTTNVNTTFVTNFSGTGGITKAGASTLVLNGTASSYAGVTRTNAGILNVATLANGGTNSSIGAATNAAGNLVLGGGTLQYTGSSAQSTDRLFSIAPNSVVPFANSTIDASGSTPVASLAFTNAGAIAQSDLSRAAALPITNTTLTGLASTADLKVGATVTGTGIAAGTTIASITNSTTIVLSQVTTNIATATNTLTFGSVDRTLVLTGTNTGANSIAGVLGDRTVTGAPTGILSVSKTGTGTWALNGANTYTGATSVTNGTLVVNGNISTSILTTVSAGATLGGTGTVAAATISGILAPGNGIGKVTATGDVTWNSNNAWVFELGTAATTLADAASGLSGQDQLDITGVSSDFIKGSGTGFTFDFGGTGANGYYKLVDWQGSNLGFNSTDFVATNLGSGLAGSFTLDNDTSALYLNVIPEPSTAVLGVLGTLALLRRRRAAVTPQK